MALNSKIEWCHHTINWWWGCVKVSPACKYCYAATLDAMRGPLFDEGRVHWGPDAPRWVKTDSASKELRSIAKKGHSRVFINSMSDTFEDHAQLPAAREILFAEIAKHPGIDFLLLTKRPENILPMVPGAWIQSWPPHIWIGTTVENQAMAYERIPELRRVPAYIRFLSCEPLLGPIDLGDLSGIHWVICGGESGKEARPMNPDWARSLRDQCSDAGVPFLFKQWGEWFFDTRLPSPLDIFKVGKKKAGRLLDGIEHNEFPA